jgi:hypothetical protein
MTFEPLKRAASHFGGVVPSAMGYTPREAEVPT